VNEHTVRSFDEELEHVRALIREMGVFAERQLRLGSRALLERDRAAAEETLKSDVHLDALQRDIDAGALQLLALRQPVAVDFREAIAAIRSTSDFERIGDLAKDLAKRATVLAEIPTVPSLPGLEQMTDLVAEHLGAVVRAYEEQDAQRALAVWADDAEVDDWFHSVYRELLTYMLEDPRTLTACTHLLFAAKSLERIGDHCANIAASIYYLVLGEPLPEERPKGRDSVLEDA